MKTTSPLVVRALGRAFTLIELLVVISIIAILAAVCMPAYQNAVMSGQQTAAMQNARQVGLGLRQFSNDNGGIYPSGTNSYGQQISTANDAFRSLIPTYIDNEQVFAVALSKDGPKADNVISPQDEILKAGENHWAYVEGLNDTTNSLWPLIVDGANNGTYTTDSSQLGGVWRGTKAIVINADGSAHGVPLMGPETARYIPLFNDTTQNELNVSAYMGTGPQLLEPATN